MFDFIKKKNNKDKTKYKFKKKRKKTLFSPQTPNPQRERAAAVGEAGDALTSKNGNRFSTSDKDNDLLNGSCAQLYLGAWW